MRNKVTYKSWVFRDPKITVATVGLEQSLPITTLGIDTFDVEVKCPDKSILKFQQNDPIHYFHRRQQMGIYYVQSIERVSPDRYAINAISTLGLLEQMDFYGGVYTGQTVEEVVSAICGDVPVVIKTNLQKIKLYGWLGISSARKALQQVLFAIGANLSTDNNGVLRIENLWDGISAVIPADRVYLDGGNVKQENPVTAVTVLEHQYIPGAEREDLYEGATLHGQRILFSEPCTDLEANGFTILESGANYAVVSAGSGKLTGCPYIHTTMEVTKAVTMAPVKNEKRVEDATLVSLVNSNAVADRMAAYYKCRQILSAEVVLQREHPGQVVQIQHPWDNEMVKAAISTASIDVSSILKGSISALIDFSPKQSEVLVTYEHQEIISQKSQFIIPDGCYKVRAVIMDGGDGGQAGFNGASGTSGGSASISAPATGEKVGTNGKGGKAGSAGVGGKAGKIRIVDIDVQPGQVLEISPGAGGDGGSADGEEGLPGGKTTITIDGVIYNTDDGGERPPNGYYDVITGTTYALDGADGRTGTDGTDADLSALTKTYSTTKKEWGDPEDVSGPTEGQRAVVKVSTTGTNAIRTGWPNYKKTGFIVSMSGPYGKESIGYLMNKYVTGTLYESLSGQSTAGSGPPSAISSDLPSYVETESINRIECYEGLNSTYYFRTTRIDWVTRCYMNRVDLERGHAANGLPGTTFSTPEDAVVYGCGGDGGNGGGGGFGGAAGYVKATGSRVGSLQYSITASGVHGGDGLLGTKGAKGAGGAAILYYGVEKTIKPGILVEKDLNFVVDHSGRLIIV